MTKKVLSTTSNFRRALEAWRVWWPTFVKEHDSAKPKLVAPCSAANAFPCIGVVQCDFHQEVSRQGRLVRCGCDEHYPFEQGTEQGAGSCTACRENFVGISLFEKNRRHVQRQLGVT